MRGFVQERARLAELGQQVGRTLLFFECRRQSEDFLYESDWMVGAPDALDKLLLTVQQNYKRTLGNNFEIVVAFSREGVGKIYVQDRINERAEEVNKLLLKGASVYVCGNAARMAVGVSRVLNQIIAHQRKISEIVTEEMLKSMKANGKYQACFRPLTSTYGDFKC